MGAFAKRVGIVTLLSVAVLTAQVWAQSQAVRSSAAPVDRPKFSVASVKLNRPEGPGPRFTVTQYQPGGRFTATGAQLRTLIASAYQLKPDQVRSISGVPGWANSEAFDIEAKAEGNPSREQISLMLQTLLADRFKLVAHLETRRLPVYALVVSKAGRTGPHLQPHSDATDCLKLTLRARSRLRISV